MKKCVKCNTGMWKLEAETLEGVKYKYYHCSRCGGEIMDESRLQAIAENYRIGVKSL